MQIIAHRGYWTKDCEKNTLTAFKRAFELDFGVELDVRDSNKKIVISHDMPSGDEIEFSELLKIAQNKFLAINIKCDGISLKVKRLLEKYNHTNYFTFDMSIAELPQYAKNKLNFFVGLNDITKTAPMLNEAQGVWLDGFFDDWFSGDDIQKILNKNKKVCVVSPELHNREYKKIWIKYKNIQNIMLCTDYPKEALEFFK